MGFPAKRKRSIFVSAAITTAGAADDLSAWGEPVATATDVDGNVRLDLHDADGSAVLVWITDLGDGSVGDRYSAAIAEIRVFAS